MWVSSWGRKRPIKPRTKSCAIELGDLDDDESLEIGFATRASKVCGVYFDGTDFDVITLQTAGSVPSFIQIADSNGDLKDDLVVHSALSRCVSYYYQNNFAPVAVGSVDGTGHREGDEITFNATLSTDTASDRDRLIYTWTFDDGTSVVVTTNTTTHTYLWNGTFNVVLTVTDPGLLNNSTSFEVTIEDKGPSADLSYDGIDHYQGAAGAV
jgi:hypothetical protein